MSSPSLSPHPVERKPLGVVPPPRPSSAWTPPREPHLLALQLSKAYIKDPRLLAHRLVPGVPLLLGPLLMSGASLHQGPLLVPGASLLLTTLLVFGASPLLAPSMAQPLMQPCTATWLLA